MAKDALIAFLKDDQRYSREQIASLFVKLGLQPPEPEPAPPLKAPAGTEPYEDPFVSRPVAWRNMNAAGGHLDKVLRGTQAREAMRHRGSPAAHDEGLHAAAETTE